MKKRLDMCSYLIIAFYFCFLIYGVLVYKDYGITPDDEPQRYHSMVAYNDIILKDKEYATQSIQTEQLPSLAEYGANYGVFLQLPLMAAEHLNGFQYTYLEIYQMRHLYVFLWFFVSAIFFYRLCRTLTNGDRWLSFLGVLMLILFPRTLADSFYNIKDLLCMPLYIIATYYGVSFLKKESVRALALFVLFAALCTTTRVVGGVLIAALFLVIIVKSLCEGTWKKYFLYLAAMCLVFLTVYILMTPKSWGNIVQNLWSTIKTFSNYTTWDSKVFYMGEWVRGHSLPWHYLFVWIGITVPFIYLVFMIVGLGSSLQTFICSVIKQKQDQVLWIRLFLILSAAIPFAYVVIVRPVLYNGWRHFYFTYPVLVIQAVYGIQKAQSWFAGRGWRMVCSGILLISMGATGFWIIRNHPYEYVYFNPVFREYAFSHFDLDYWCITELECYQYILENDDGENIQFYELSTACTPAVLDTEEKCPLVPVSDWSKAEWVIDDGYGFDGSDSFECVKTISVDSHPIRSVWKRKSQNIISYTVERNAEGSFSFDINDISWEWEEQDSQIVFTGTLKEGIPASRVQVETVQQAEIPELFVEVSENGKEWKSVTTIAESMDCPIETVAYIRVECLAEEAGREEFGFRITLQGDIETMRSVETAGNRAIEGIETNSEGSSPVNNVRDENRETRWEVNNQLPGTYLSLQLKEVYEISRILLDYGESKYDYAHELHIYTSMDGETWDEQEFHTEDNKNYYLQQAVSCQYIKLELGDTGEQIDESWSIYEIKLY